MRETDRTARKAYQLKMILERLFESETELKIVVDGVEIFGNRAVYMEFGKYADWFYAPIMVYETHVDDFRELWKEYILVNGENLKREFDALYSEYNPIENYALQESGIDGVKRDRTTTETTPTGKTKTTDSLTQTGMNSAGNGALTDTRENETEFTNRKDTTTTTPDNTKTADFDGTTHTGYNEAREHFFKRSGNIGVQTAMDMIKSEVAERQAVDLLGVFVRRFIYRHCFWIS